MCARADIMILIAAEIFTFTLTILRRSVSLTEGRVLSVINVQGIFSGPIIMYTKHVV
jgi:hypothetical protein